MLGESLSFMPRDTGSYIEPTRAIDHPIAVAVLVPVKMQRVDINDPHISLARFHAENLRETARQMVIKVVGELIQYTGCSEAKGRGVVVLWTASCRSTRPPERLFVNLSGKKARSPGGVEYLIVIVNDYSRLAWPYFLKKKSDVPAVFAKFSI